MRSRGRGVDDDIGALPALLPGKLSHPCWRRDANEATVSVRPAGSSGDRHIQRATKEAAVPARGSLVEPIAVGLVALVAGGAASVGALVPSMAVSANWGFGLACTALVVWAASRLGILGPVERLWRWHRR